MTNRTCALRSNDSTPARRLVAAGIKRGTGPLTLIIEDYEAAADVVAQFASLAVADLRDSQVDAIDRAHATLTNIRGELAQSGHLHFVDRTVPVPAISREVLRLRTTMRAAGYSPDQPHKIKAVAIIAGVNAQTLADVLVGRAPYGPRIPKARLADVLAAASAA